MSSFKISRLSEDDDLGTFTCGSSDDDNKLNTFLKERALSHQQDLIATTELLTDTDNTIVGFMTLLCDSVEVEPNNRERFQSKVSLKYPYRMYPALKIGRMAVHKDYKKGGIKASQNVGTYLFNLAVGIAIKNNKLIGTRFIVVDTKEQSRKWYLEKLNFKVLDESDPDILFYDLKGWKNGQ